MRYKHYRNKNTHLIRCTGYGCVKQGLTVIDVSMFQLSNHLFEELAMDVYDEVDRRENDSVWLFTHDHTSIVSDRQAVPFLPVNPEFSATRNQVGTLCLQSNLF